MRPLYRSLPLVGGNLPILSSRATVIKKLILPTLFLAFLNPFSVLAASIDTVKFSIDPASPAIAGGITPDDVLTARSYSVYTRYQSRP